MVSAEQLGNTSLHHPQHLTKLSSATKNILFTDNQVDEHSPSTSYPTKF
jgi:hypothetical protein